MNRLFTRVMWAVAVLMVCVVCVALAAAAPKSHAAPATACRGPSRRARGCAQLGRRLHPLIADARAAEGRTRARVRHAGWLSASGGAACM